MRPTSQPMHSMKIRDLQLQVRLGCSAEERSVPQEVRVSIDFRFFDEPKGALSDDLKDTICYARVCEALRHQVEGREYRLVEKLAADFYGVVKLLVEGRAEVSLTVHKVRPPIEGLLGGVQYRIGDFA